MRLQDGTRLGTYEIVSPIGAGGMGEEYRAVDTRLGRTVAIKTLPAELASDARLKIRFEREAKAISSLNHPNICTLYDVGDSYIVMEYCEGTTLSARILEGPLPVGDVLRYGTEIADALDRAHGQGIVHRDLKPSNVMITASGVKLLDFGLAQRQTALSDDATTATALTEKGTIVGTVQYIAPEVLRDGAADERSDVFALGLVLYEMVTGKRAFDGMSRAALIAAILERDPVPPSQVNPKTPPSLDLLIRACLAKDPEERVQTANDVRMQLRAISEGTASSPRGRLYAAASRSSPRRPWKGAAAAVALLAILAGVAFWQWRGHPAAVVPPIDSIVVLPFENLSSASDEYIAAGMQDGVIAELSQLSRLRVISRTSAMHYGRSSKTMPEIARELNVTGIVEGSVQRASDGVRVQVKLMRVRPDERQIWSKTYEREILGATAAQTDIARAIAIAAHVALSDDESARLARPRTANPATYDTYLKGMFYVRQLTPDSAQKGLAYLQDVVAKDPSDPAAHAGLALAWSIISHSPAPPPDAQVHAKSEAMKAIALDDTVADAHAALGAIAMYHDWDWTTAGRELRRALQLNPNLAQAHRDLAWFVELSRLNPESIVEMKRAQALDPLTRLYTSDLSWLYFRHGLIDQAVQQGRAAAALDPDWVSQFSLVIALCAARQYDEAIVVAQRAAKKPAAKFVLAYAYARAGRKADAEKVAADAAKSPTPASMWGLAYAYAALGDNDETLRWIEKAIDRRFSFMLWIKDNPVYAPLRGDPRFQAQVRRLKLPA